MAKGKKTGSRKKARTPAQKAASLRNLAKARSARKRATKRHDVKAYRYHRPAKSVHVSAHKSWEGRRGGQTAKQRAASLRNIKKAHSARRGHGAREGRGHRTAKQRAASRRNIKKAQRARRGSEGAYESHPKKSGKRRKARKNPQGPMEMFFGGITLLVGFGFADFTDRLWATSALVDKNAKDASGRELFADPGGKAGSSYAGLFNPTAITAPMNAVRWFSGGFITIVPLWAATYKGFGDVGKSALQMFGYGAGARILGKGLIDLLAVLTRNTQTGQRLYDGEMRAMALKRGDGSEASLPSAGLGKTLGCAGGCGGTCASCAAVAADLRRAKAGAGAGAGADTSRSSAGTGWPSTSREVASKSGTSTTAPQLTPPPPPPPPLVTQTQPLTGVRNARPNPFRWGEERHAA